MNWNIMNNIMTVDNESDNGRNWSNFFNCAHHSNGKLHPRARINGVRAYEYLKKLIHKRYIDTGTDTFKDDCAYNEGKFRCKLCGFTHGSEDINVVARFTRITSDSHEIIDGADIYFPKEIDLGSRCMVNFEAITKRHAIKIERRKAIKMQIAWLESKFNDTSYSFTTSSYRSKNRCELDAICNNIKKGILSSDDIYTLTHRIYYNMKGNMPLRLYKNIVDGSLKDDDINRWIIGKRVTKRMTTNLIITDNYIEVPYKTTLDI